MTRHDRQPQAGTWVRSAQQSGGRFLRPALQGPSVLHETEGVLFIRTSRGGGSHPAVPCHGRWPSPAAVRKCPSWCQAQAETDGHNSAVSSGSSPRLPRPQPGTGPHVCSHGDCHHVLETVFCSLIFTQTSQNEISSSRK